MSELVSSILQNSFEIPASVDLLPVQVAAIKLYYHGIVNHDEVSHYLNIKPLRARKIVTEIYERLGLQSPSDESRGRMQLLYSLIHGGIIPSFFGKNSPEFPLQKPCKPIVEKEKDALLAYSLGLERYEIAELFGIPEATLRCQFTSVRRKFPPGETNNLSEATAEKMPYQLMSMWMLRSNLVHVDPYAIQVEQPPFFLLNMQDQRATYFGESGIRANCLGTISPHDPLHREFQTEQYLEP